MTQRVVGPGPTGSAGPSRQFPEAPLSLSSIEGVAASGVACGIKESGRPDLGLLVLDRPVSGAAVFTQNHFAAAPVRVSRQHLATSGGLVRAVVVNSGNANACTGRQGLDDAREMCALVARALGCPVEQVFVCSTGVIGMRLPMERVRAGIASALDSLSKTAEAGRRFHEAILTTDAFYKDASLQGSGFAVAGVCKGAGMIEPNMATMLAFIATDAAVPPEALQRALPAIAARSFNSVHVDTHTSTNDTFLVLATGHRVVPEQAWSEAISSVSRRLAWLIARDGEGASKVVTIAVRGATTDAKAREVARHVASSALVRTALYGNDPNWGRFVSQVGNVAGLARPERLRCVLQGIEVFRDGEPTAFDRAIAAAAMAKEDVLLELALDEGKGTAALMTADLGPRYVEINAEYTT